MIARNLKSLTISSLENFPVIGIVGPRQVGKSTLAKEIISSLNSAYLDLEKPEDLAILEQSSFYLRDNIEKIVCLDEIQRKAELFPLLRSLIDEFDRKPRFLVLGSASPELLRQGSESLAGRIKYYELTPFLLNEVPKNSLQRLWLRGGFPLSFLASSDSISYEWRESFVSTYLERDLAAFGFRRSSKLVRRVWTMLAHYHGQVLNKAKLSQSVELSAQSITGYLEMLEDTFMLRVLEPFITNTKKRLVKSPKIYIRDTGLLHYLLRIRDWEGLYRHPAFGASWEGLVIETILSNLNLDWNAYFYQTSRGDELDLVLQNGKRTIAVECKASDSPTLTPSNIRALNEVEPEKLYIVAPVQKSYRKEANIFVCNLEQVIDELTADSSHDCC